MQLYAKLGRRNDIECLFKNPTSHRRSVPDPFEFKNAR